MRAVLVQSWYRVSGGIPWMGDSKTNLEQPRIVQYSLEGQHDLGSTPALSSSDFPALTSDTALLPYPSLLPPPPIFLRFTLTINLPTLAAGGFAHSLCRQYHH